MRTQIGKTIFALNAHLVFYALLIPLLVIFATVIPERWEMYMAIVLWLVTIASITFFVKVKLKEQRTWAWIAAVVICATSVFSLLMPFSIYGLIGLLSTESRNLYLKTQEIL